MGSNPIPRTHPLSIGGRYFAMLAGGANSLLGLPIMYTPYGFFPSGISRKNSDTLSGAARTAPDRVGEGEPTMHIVNPFSMSLADDDMASSGERAKISSSYFPSHITVLGSLAPWPARHFLQSLTPGIESALSPAMPQASSMNASSLS